MNKRDLKLLERVFMAHVECRLPYQSKSKQMLKLEAEGYVQRDKRTIPATRGCPWPMDITGWSLTHLGMLSYCMTCDEPDETPTVTSERAP